MTSQQVIDAEEAGAEVGFVGSTDGEYHSSSIHSISIPSILDGNKALKMRKECTKMEATTPPSTFTIVSMVCISKQKIFNLVVAPNHRLKKKGINILKHASKKNGNMQLKYTVPEHSTVDTFYDQAINKYSCNLIED